MLLTETIGFDSLKNDEGQSKLPIKERGGMESQQCPHSRYHPTANCILPYIYLPFREQCNGKGWTASYHTHKGSSKHLELEMGRFRAQP